MKLIRVIVDGFRSIKSREELLIDKNVTILIGANDHGKSNLLEAILRLNPDKPISQDDKNWDLDEKDQPRIEWHFTIESAELEKFIDTTKQKNSSRRKTSSSVQIVGNNEINYLPKNDKNLLIYYKEGIGSNLKILSVPFAINVRYEQDILNLSPKVENFIPITTNLKDEITLAQLENPQFEFMQGLFQLAQIWENRNSLFSQNDRSSRTLELASSNLTEILNKEWNQGRELVWKFKHAGTNGDHIQIRIEDPAVEKTLIRPSSRSSGFQTFFVLSMMIKARTYNKNPNSYIFLFDEPGTYLHPHAQLDLQRSFETISNNAQVIYTTHSLFLVNKNHPHRNRVISKTVDGTKIDKKPFQRNWKSVRESLGILFSNNFLIADKTLLVEGPSDVIYILTAIKFFKKTGQIDIDINDFCIVDAGSSENYVALAKVMLSEGRSIVALADGDLGGQRILTKLKRSCSKEIGEGKLQIIELLYNKSIEDIFTDLTLLKDGIKQLSEELTQTGERTYTHGFNLALKIDDILPEESKSLGLIIKEKTSQWFTSNDELSKLSIALLYENLVSNNKANLDNTALKFIKEICEKMKLRGEQSVEPGVFEDIK